MNAALRGLLQRFAAEGGLQLRGYRVRLPMTEAEVQAFHSARAGDVMGYRVLACPECGGSSLIRPHNARKWEPYCGSACRARVWRRERGAVSRSAT